MLCVRQGEEECAPFTRPTVDPDLSSMGLDDAAGDVETEPGASRCRPNLRKASENTVVLAGGNARPGVRDRDPEPVALLDLEADRAPLRRELDGISEEIREHLQDPIAIEARDDGLLRQPRLER